MNITLDTPLCKALGVHRGMPFNFRGKRFVITYDPLINSERVAEYGKKVNFCTLEEIIKLNEIDTSLLVLLINCSNEIICHKIFTPQEIEDAKTLHRLWDMTKITRDNHGCICMLDRSGTSEELCFDAFPSIYNNESYTYEQIVNKENV